MCFLFWESSACPGWFSLDRDPFCQKLFLENVCAHAVHAVKVTLFKVAWPWCFSVVTRVVNQLKRTRWKSTTRRSAEIAMFYPVSTAARISGKTSVWRQFCNDLWAKHHKNSVVERFTKIRHFPEVESIGGSSQPKFRSSVLSCIDCGKDFWQDVCVETILRELGQCPFYWNQSEQFSQSRDPKIGHCLR